MNIGNENNILFYNDKEGNVRVEVILQDENVWLNVEAIARLFEVQRPAIVKHISNIYSDEELNKEATCSILEQVQIEGERAVKRKREYYNLDMIISIGFRVNSKKAIRFRTWANKIIKEYMIKGYNLDVERFKNNSDNPYFEELLNKIRDIRSSEKVFWRKILDIYATSIDYDPKSELSINFFKTVQNKMHYATHGNTAAEIIFERVDANKRNLGLTNFKGDIPTRQEVEIAKNYLTEDELNVLNRMVSAYLDIAEINALDRRVMKMQDWINELDDFLKLTRKDILNHKGIVSHEQALKKAHEEYDKYMESHLTQAERDYLTVLNKTVEDLNK